jgi:hypothetical protein
VLACAFDPAQRPHPRLVSNAGVDRDLFITVEMLRAGGLNARVRLDDGAIEVSLERHVAVFRTPDLGVAADWLAGSALRNYPGSDFAKLRRLLASAVIARI